MPDSLVQTLESTLAAAGEDPPPPTAFPVPIDAPPEKSSSLGTWITLGLLGLAGVAIWHVSRAPSAKPLDASPVEDPLGAPELVATLEDGTDILAAPIPSRPKRKPKKRKPSSGST